MQCLTEMYNGTQSVVDLRVHATMNKNSEQQRHGRPTRGALQLELGSSGRAAVCH